MLVLDVLSGKTPLYRVHERLATTNLEVLVGPGGLHRDRLERALDKLSRSEPATVFITLSMAAFAADEIPLRTRHGDSTSSSGTMRSRRTACTPPMAIRRIATPT